MRVQKSARDGDALPLPARQLTGKRPLSARQPDAAEHGAHLSPLLLGEDEAEVLLRREIGQELGRLEEIGTGLCALRFPRKGGLPREDIEQGGLARAALTEHRGDRPFGKFQRDMFEGDAVAVALADIP